MASLGNIRENGHVGLLLVDFFETQVGLHVNGRATVVAPRGAGHGRRAGDVFKTKNAERAWLRPGCEVEALQIGEVRFADAPARTHSASGRRLPLPVRK